MEFLQLTDFDNGTKVYLSVADITAVYWDTEVKCTVVLCGREWMYVKETADEVMDMIYVATVQNCGGYKFIISKRDIGPDKSLH